MISDIKYLTEQFDQLQAEKKDGRLKATRQEAFRTFSKLGVPTSRHEEWKYTRVGSLFNKEYRFRANPEGQDLDFFHLPGHEQANELVFINGRYDASHSCVRSAALVVLPLEEASKNEYSDIVKRHFNHSANYLKDGIHALNTAFVEAGVFVHVKDRRISEHPIYIYNIADAREEQVFAQPRSLIHVGDHAQVQIVEIFSTIGKLESFTNQVMEIVAEAGSNVEFYKIQNDASHNSQVSTTHIRQIGKSYTHTVTISLNGGIVRNNLNVILEADHSESHLYGLYYQNGHSHIDNHTIVDNVRPDCFSNELYKGMLDENSTGVFNGKIFVRQLAQKTNAYQSNKNILLSENASVNTKPQLEIFADDVKCSHGCTVGRLDEEGLFYLQSRGIPEKIAKSMLLHGFTSDVLEKIKCQPIRAYVDQLISERLQFDNI